MLFSLCYSLFIVRPFLQWKWLTLPVLTGSVAFSWVPSRRVFTVIINDAHSVIGMLVIYVCLRVLQPLTKLQGSWTTWEIHFERTHNCNNWAEQGLILYWYMKCCHIVMYIIYLVNMFVKVNSKICLWWCK